MISSNDLAHISYSIAPHTSQITWSHRQRDQWGRQSAPTADAHDGRPAGQPEAGVAAAESHADHTQGFGRLRHEGTR